MVKNKVTTVRGNVMSNKFEILMNQLDICHSRIREIQRPFESRNREGLVLRSVRSGNFIFFCEILHIEIFEIAEAADQEFSNRQSSYFEIHCQAPRYRMSSCRPRTSWPLRKVHVPCHGFKRPVSRICELIG